MQLYYRILEVHNEDGLMVVRFWTDKLSEQALSVKWKDPAVHPDRCRYDVTIQIWDHTLDEEQIHDYILNYAPVKHFELIHKHLDGNVDYSKFHAKKGKTVQFDHNHIRERQLAHMERTKQARIEHEAKMRVQHEKEMKEHTEKVEKAMDALRSLDIKK